jgi:hypothetical protein
VRKILPWILSVILIAAAYLLGTVTLTHWLAGREFHTFLEKKSSEALQATASFGPLHWGWFELSASHFLADGRGMTSLHKLEAEGLHGRLNPSALLHGLWNIEEISLDRLTLHLGSSHVAQETFQQSQSAPTYALPSWIPTVLAIDVIRAGKADITIELPSGKFLELRNTRLEARPKGKETAFKAWGGILQTPFLPEFNLVSANGRMKEKSVELADATLSFVEGGGSIHLDGHFPDAQESTLNGGWSDVPLGLLLPSLASRLVGTVEGASTIHWDQKGFQSAKGKILAHNTILSGVPILEGIARLTQMEAFHHLFLQQAKATFSMSGGVTSWRDVTLESEGLLKLVGSAETQQDGGISGSFQLGLSSPIVTVIPGASQVFSKDQHDGYFWAPLHISGSLSHPTEDLTQRITEAVLSNAALLIQQGVKQGLQILGISGDQVPRNSSGTNTQPQATPPPANHSDAATPATKAALDILDNFLK